MLLALRPSCFTVTATVGSGSTDSLGPSNFLCNEMGLQAPPNMLGFLFCLTTLVMAIIALGLTAYVCDSRGYGWCKLVVPPEPAAAVGMSITAAVFGIVAAGLAVAWFVVEPLWDSPILRWIVVLSLAFTTLLAFVAGVIYAYCVNFSAGPYPVSHYLPVAAAACAWQWFLFLLAAISAILCYRAGGSGTPATQPVAQ